MKRILRRQDGVSEEVPLSLAEIAPLLRVADEVEPINSRVAFLCRFYAFEKAYRLGPMPRKSGAMQFRTALLQRLERESEATRASRLEQSDALEMQNFYQLYHQKYIQAPQDAADSLLVTEARQIAGMLFEVLKAVTLTESKEINAEILDAYRNIVEKTSYVPFNIIPLDTNGVSKEFITYPEIQSTVCAMKKTTGLPWYKECEVENGDILHWLQVTFGFQEDNVANQREHLILLLANADSRRSPENDQQPKLDILSLDEVMNKVLKNYLTWCKHINLKSSLRFPAIREETDLRRLLYMGLYLLIWGEAANLRFMPECICYIYHHLRPMVRYLHVRLPSYKDLTSSWAGYKIILLATEQMVLELNAMLSDNVNHPVSDETVKPSNKREEGTFLKKIVTPLYEVIAREAVKSKNGTATYSEWRNYDDLNEYFWSVDCFSLGWPLHCDAEFFNKPPELLQSEKNKNKKPSKGQCMGKVNFVEIRSFWHILRSFSRLWTFLIVCLQAMITIAWSGSGQLSSVFDADVLKNVLSIFITAAIMKLGHAILDITFIWKASMTFHVKLRNTLKLLAAAAWVTILLLTYPCTWGSRFGYVQTIKSRLGISSTSTQLYYFSAIIFLSPKMLAAVLFIFPTIDKFISRSNYKIVLLLKWLSQHQLYVGRGMHVSSFSRFKYGAFWIPLLIVKLTFSYYIEIKPLVSQTKEDIGNIRFFVATWPPIILVYLMDTQIWYAIFSAIWGCVYGAFHRIGEIGTLGTVRSRFDSLPGAFNSMLIPEQKNEPFENEGSRETSSGNYKTVLSSKDKKAARFAHLWNKIITSFREEDLLSNREMDMLLVPNWTDHELENFIHWPPVLLATQIPTAINMAKDSMGKDNELKKQLESDRYMLSAVRECYTSIRQLINYLVIGSREKEITDSIFSMVNKHIEAGDLIVSLNMMALPRLYTLIIELIQLLMLNNKEDTENVRLLFQDMLEVVTQDLIEDQISSLVGVSEYEGRLPELQLFYSSKAIQFPSLELEEWEEKIKRLYLLLTMNESTKDVPINSEARRRISFFSNSLFMDMPPAPTVSNMLAFSVLTPYCDEDVLFALDELQKPNDEGVSTLRYLQKLVPDEWTNFLERVDCCSEEDLYSSREMEEELCLWASYRGHTLTRTVRGMMYYQQALELQAYLDMVNNDDLAESYTQMKINADQIEEKATLGAKCQAMVNMKFTYVLSCPHYGIYKRSGDSRAKDIMSLMAKYPSLRVAYIDEIVETSNGGTRKVNYYSTLIKCTVMKSSSQPCIYLDQVIYRIKLPGPAILGEGKPENLNHAIIFTRGEGLQIIDANQDNHMEEALKVRNLLQEFLKDCDGKDPPAILGLREHIFTGSASSIASFILNLECSYMTIVQRLLANPLKVRFHYGHSDVFDRLFHLTRGGVGKASKVINITDGIFAGINSILREGSVTHHEYIQVGKGREVGLDQIYLFEEKMANGNGEQTLSRDFFRLGQFFDFFRMLSFYFTTVGEYFSPLIALLVVYVFLYGCLYHILSDPTENTHLNHILIYGPLQVGLATQSLVHIGFLVAISAMIEIALEKGFLLALSEFVFMLLQLAPVFFAFSIGTKTHYYARTLLHGGANSQSSTRGLVSSRSNFVENYRLYSRSHFVKGFELMMLLIVYQLFDQSNDREDSNGLWKVLTFFTSPSSTYIFIWFLVISWLFAPFLFNPSQFEWEKVLDGWNSWNKWITNKGGLGVTSDQSWESWWEDEHKHLRHTGMNGIIAELLLALRFFGYQCGFIYFTILIQESRFFLAYGVPWLMIFLILSTQKMILVAQKQFSANFQLIYRLIKSLIAVVSIIVFVIALRHMKLRHVILCIFSFIASGWGFLLVAQALKPLFVRCGMWESVVTLARGYDTAMGFFLFACSCLSGAIGFWIPNFNFFQQNFQQTSSAFLFSRHRTGRKHHTS